MVIWSVQYLRRCTDKYSVKQNTPPFSSELFDTYASIVARREDIYHGLGVPKKATLVSESRIKELELNLIQMISERIGNSQLAKTAAASLLKDIYELEKKINKSPGGNSTNELTMDRVAPPRNHAILFFLVCASADIELNYLKKQFRSHSRDRKRLKSGKSVQFSNSAVLDLQSLTSTSHWHQASHENPIPDGILNFVMQFEVFKIFINETFNRFQDGSFPDETVLRNLNKGGGVYFPWSIQNLTHFLTTLGIENSSQKVEHIFKKLAGKSFSIKRVLAKKNLGHLPDPHAVYIQLQALMIAARLVS